MDQITDFEPEPHYVPHTYIRVIKHVVFPLDFELIHTVLTR